MSKRCGHSSPVAATTTAAMASPRVRSPTYRAPTSPPSSCTGSTRNKAPGGVLGTWRSNPGGTRGPNPRSALLFRLALGSECLGDAFEEFFHGERFADVVDD